MKNVTQYSVVRPILVICVICFTIFLSSCSSLIRSLDKYSGVTLYETAVKSNGDLLAYAPDIQSEVYKHLDTPREKRLFQAFQRDFIARIVNQNPDFAKEFYNKMHSQNREKINQALTDAGILLEKELQSFTGKSEVSPENVVNAVLEKYKDA